MADLVPHFGRNDAPDSAPGVLNIPLSSGNEVDVAMEYCLPCNRPGVYPHVESLDLAIAFSKLSLPDHKEVMDGIPLDPGSVKIISEVPLGNDEGMPFRYRKFI